MLWLVTYNPEINKKTEDIKIIKYLPLCEWYKENKEKYVEKPNNKSRKWKKKVVNGF